ncbi:carboxymuconolactone decarboxylase family protein [Streptomyces sp. NBC_01795]|uniref:carboxymuconolactone decarboxylase family protein n=1 Tax=unclassified Streptomyces TaxID=2593676 RepID=UPI002DD98C58|nr:MULTISPECIES: carboxymuconolactone decarboxylase family protein [unclassified Streptomyces]WSA92363.1 carboxymuconolactone decarboxylase family protein [Streptomyces sp. NBC_01795]WSB76731.1 carboxymuconolactone decarboxylase family protein [Streptomyces sp. NBC_01775]
MSVTAFTDHTPQSAPQGARRIMEATTRQLGFLPAAMARLAGSPELLEAFHRMSALFETTSLEPLARETVILTVAVRNECHVCVAMHTRKLQALGADEELTRALRAQSPLPDERLEAVRVFTCEVLDRSGDVGEERLNAFLAQGHTSQQALEVVLGIGVYTLSTLANKLTGAPVDPGLVPFA